jgi:cytochrome P450
VPLTTDPPEHKFYRRALQPFFTPAAAARLEDQIREIVIERIESFAADGHADLVAELAIPVPCIVIALILGLDRGHWSSFMEWVDGMEAASHVGEAVLARAIEESLRFESPVFGLARTVTCPVTVQERDLEPGDKVLLMFGAAALVRGPLSLTVTWEA